ncbi:hypothetical protein ES703_27112 [subsurface metagenome]
MTQDLIEIDIPISFTAPFLKTLHIPISFIAPLTKIVEIPVSFVVPLTKLVNIAISFVAPWKSITPPPPPSLSSWEWLKEHPGYLIGAGGIMLIGALGALWPRGKG